MAFELGSIIARIKADTTDFKRGMGEAKNAGGQFSNTMKNGVGHSQAFAKGLAVVGAALVAAGGFAVKSAAGLEQTHAAFTTMLGDGAKAGQLMKELNTFAASTPFEFPELADAGKKLLAYGFSAADIIPTLTRLGDVSSGLNIPIGELSDLYGKARVQGRLFMEDYNQFTGRGIPLGRELAKQFGVTEDKVRELVESGKVGFPEVEKAMKALTSEGGMFAGGMMRQSKTVNGMISTLKDNIGAFARELVGLGADGSIAEGSIFAKVRSSLASMLDFMDKNKARIIGFFKTMAGAISDNAPIIIGVILGLLVPALWALSRSAITAGLSFLAAMWPFVLAGAVLGLLFQKFRPQIMAVVDVLKGYLLPIFEDVKTAVMVVVDVFRDFDPGALMNSDTYAAWLPFIDVINRAKAVLTTVKDTLKSVGEVLITAFKVALDLLMPSLTALWNTISTQILPAFLNWVKAAMDFWNFVSPVLIPVLGVLAAILGGILVAAVWLAINVINIIINVITGLINFSAMLLNVTVSVWNAIFAVISWAINAAIAWFHTFVAIWGTIGNLIFAAAAAIWNAVFAIISGVIRQAGNVIGTLIGIVSAIFSGIWGIVSNVVQGNIPGAFRAAVNMVQSIFGSLTGFIGSTIGNISGIVSGVTEGIVRPFREAVERIKGLMREAKEALSNLNPFQRQSPSIVDWVKKGTAVITDEYGRMSNSIAAGTQAARIQTIGTARSMANISATQIVAQGEGKNGGSLTINVAGILADSPDAKRRFGAEIVQLINDARQAKGRPTI